MAPTYGPIFGGLDPYFFPPAAPTAPRFGELNPFFAYGAYGAAFGELKSSISACGAAFWGAKILIFSPAAPMYMLPQSLTSGDPLGAASARQFFIDI